MRSRLLVLVVILLVVLTGCGKKGPSIGDHKLVVPPGCTAENESGGGHLNCEGAHASLSWIRLTESSPEQALDKGEGIITDAMAKTAKIAKSKPACTLAGSAASCRRLDMKLSKGTLVALLGSASIDGKPYYVECSYEEPGPVHAVCNDLFGLQ